MEQDERQILIDVSVMYYLEGKTQSEIAKALFVSRPKVSRLLKKARETKVVEININYESDYLKNMQREIVRRFPVQRVVVVNTLSSSEDTLHEIGKAAAKVMHEAILPGMTIGVSWGRSVRETVSQMKSQSINDVKIVELFGAISYDMGSADALSIATNLAGKIGARVYPLPAPIFMQDQNMKKTLEKSPVIQNSLEMIENCDLILSGLGAVDLDRTQTIWDVFVESDIKEDIKAHDGVGFLCAHFFNSAGEFLDLEINRNIVGIETETINRKRIIVVAGGAGKAKAIHAALKGGKIDTLITDYKTLEYVMKAEE